MKDLVPIFIFTCDRIKVLEQALISYEKINNPIEIIFYDVGSTYQPMIEYLSRKETEGHKVYRTKDRMVSDTDLNKMNDVVLDWFNTNDAPYYVVTDPDIELDGDAYGDIFAAYEHLLQEIPDAEVVGPMLRIDDLPDFYPLKYRAKQRHYDQFWHKEPLFLNWNNKAIEYQHALIDTTFGMYRRGTEFKRLRSGVRTYAPYAARHLDWYINPDEMTGDQIHYLKKASDVSHWGGAWLREKLGNKTSD